MLSLEMNGKNYEVDVSPDVSSPWAMREHLRFEGAKLGYGMGLFAATAIHLDGKAQTATHYVPPLN